MSEEDTQGLDEQMKAWQREPRLGRNPRELTSVIEYRQPQRYGYRLAAGFSKLTESER